MVSLEESKRRSFDALSNVGLAHSHHTLVLATHVEISKAVSAHVKNCYDRIIDGISCEGVVPEGLCKEHERAGRGR